MVGVETRPLSIVKAGEKPPKGVLTPDVRSMLLSGGLGGVALAALAELISSGRHRILKRRLRKRFPTSGKGIILSIPSDEKDFDKSSDNRSDLDALKGKVHDVKAAPAVGAAGEGRQSAIDDIKGTWGGIKDTVFGAGTAFKGLLDVLTGNVPEPKAWDINSPKFIPTALGSVGLAALAFYLTQKLLHSGRTPAQKAEDAARREFRRALLESEKRSHILTPDEETGYYIVDKFADEFEKSGNFWTIGTNTGLATAALAGYLAYSIEKKRRLKQLRRAWVDLQRTRNPRIEAQRIPRDILSEPVGLRRPIPRALVKTSSPFGGMSGYGVDAFNYLRNTAQGAATRLGLVPSRAEILQQLGVPPKVVTMLQKNPEIRKMLPKMLEFAANNPGTLERLPKFMKVLSGNPKLLEVLQTLKPEDIQRFQQFNKDPTKFLLNNVSPTHLASQAASWFADTGKNFLTQATNDIGAKLIGAENMAGLGLYDSFPRAAKWWLRGGGGLLTQVKNDLGMPSIPGAAAEG